eukprot:CAMPEP_0177665136 /NCGR_PEP_ID=MMETSP0447-20121125/20886_1 /TAXON_ID=0 /ORGANISM="Stygamoeba regulata, Strain BSH-02190019" /LENGTH=801 /DNA_ID=CAMNT_0019171195 /DNA_START=53 /DNA_END=2458 /DNA_ORIENTATION=+
MARVLLAAALVLLCWFAEGEGHSGHHRGGHYGGQSHGQVGRWPCEADKQRLCADETNVDEVRACLARQNDLSDACSDYLRSTHAWWACHEDTERLCPNDPIVDCLKDYMDELSEDCLAAVSGVGKGVENPTSASPPMNDWPCQRDLREHCPAVPENNREGVMACLDEHNSELSDVCNAFLYHERNRPASPLAWWNCHLDRLRLCPGFAPNDFHGIHECMIQHRSELSDACESVVKQHENVMSEKPQPAEAPAVSEGSLLLFQECHDDRLRFCPDVRPPFFAAKLFSADCFGQHVDELSPGCRRLFDIFHASSGSYHESDSTSPPPAVTLFTACHNDRVRLCPDIPPPFFPAKLFGSECFKEHRGDLSDACARLMDTFTQESMPPQRGIPSAAPEPVPATPPIPMGPAYPVSDADLVSCNMDRVRLCPDLRPPFTHRALFTSPCFKEHREDLSTECQQLMTRFLESEAGQHNPTPIVTLSAMETACGVSQRALCPKEPLSPDLFKTSCFRSHEDKFSDMCKYMAHLFVEGPREDESNPLHCVEEWTTLCPSEWRESNGQPHILFKSKCMEQQAPRMSRVCLTLVRQLLPAAEMAALAGADECAVDKARFCPYLSDSAELFEARCFLQQVNFITMPCRHKYVTWIHNHVNSDYKDPLEHDVEGEKNYDSKHSVYGDCSLDKMRLCPHSRVDWREKHFFEDRCIHSHLHELTSECRTRLHHYMRKMSTFERVKFTATPLTPAAITVLAVCGVAMAFLLLACCRTLFCSTSSDSEYSDLDATGAILLGVAMEDGKKGRQVGAETV